MTCFKSQTHMMYNTLHHFRHIIQFNLMSVTDMWSTMQCTFLFVCEYEVKLNTKYFDMVSQHFSSFEIKHVWELKDVISNDYSNVEVMICRNVRALSKLWIWAWYLVELPMYTVVFQVMTPCCSLTATEVTMKTEAVCSF